MISCTGYENYEANKDKSISISFAGNPIDISGNIRDIDEAWFGNGRKRIYAHANENTIYIVASSGITNGYKDITPKWKKIKKDLENGIISEELKETLNITNEEDSEMDKNMIKEPEMKEEEPKNMKKEPKNMNKKENKNMDKEKNTKKNKRNEARADEAVRKYTTSEASRYLDHQIEEKKIHDTKTEPNSTVITDDVEPEKGADLLEETPTTEAPTEEAPAEEAPTTEEAPAEAKTQTEETLVEAKAQTEEVPVEEAQTEEVPAEAEQTDETESVKSEPEPETAAIPEMETSMTPAEQYKKDRENIIADLKKNGIDIANATNGTVKIADGSEGEWNLYVKAIKPRRAQLVYKIFEINLSGETDEMENNKTILSPAQLIQGVTKLNTILSNMQGYYEDDIVNIELWLKNIAKYRLLAPVSIDCDILNINQVVENLKNWFGEHVCDPQVAAFEMGGQVHVAIVKRGEKTPYRMFNEIIAEIAPANKPTRIKDTLYENGFLIHDEGTGCNDSQKTISLKIRDEIGATGDKCISFDFGKDFNQKFYEYYQNQTRVNEEAC